MPSRCERRARLDLRCPPIESEPRSLFFLASRRAVGTRLFLQRPRSMQDARTRWELALPPWTTPGPPLTERSRRERSKGESSLGTSSESADRAWTSEGTARRTIGGRLPAHPGLRGRGARETRCSGSAERRGHPFLRQR